MSMQPTCESSRHTCPRTLEHKIRNAVQAGADTFSLNATKTSSDGLPYEKRADGKGEVRCIADEVPFELPKGWAWARLEDACRTIVDCPHSTPQYLADETGYVAIDTNCIDDGWHLTGTRNLSKESYETRVARYVPKVGDLIFTREGSIGRSLIIDRKHVCLGQRVMLISTFQDVLTNTYCQLVLSSPYAWTLYEAANVGTGVKHINVAMVRALLLPVPPLPEQGRIVAALDRCLSLVDTVERDGRELGALFGRLRSKVLDLAVRGELTERDPSDEPAGELLARIHDEKLAMVGRGELKPKDVKGDTVIFTGSDGLRYEKPADGRGEPVCIEDEIPFEIPETWAWARLGSLGRIVGGGTPKTSEPEYWAAAKMGIPWITPADMSTNGGLMIDGGSRDITKAGLEKSSAQLLRSGAVVMSSRAPIGYIGIATHPLCTNQGCKSVDLALPELGVWIAMCLRGLMADILRRASGTTFQEISGSEFSRTLVPIAPLNEQKRARLLFLELRNSLTNL